MYILVFNAGSSSVKFTCFTGKGEDVLAEGMVERIGLAGTTLHYRPAGGPAQSREVDITSTSQAVAALTGCLVDEDTGCLESLAQVQAVGHRVVHGGDKISEPVVVNQWLKAVIREYFELAPLHNPPNLEGIEAAEAILPQAVHVAVFDTAFHSTIPPRAYLYALPVELCRRDKIRRYGFHGISHQYVSAAAAAHLGPEKAARLISCHLGNGCSMTAVRDGRSLDTSMGLTPLQGLVMGTRCGDLDPAIVLHLMEHKGLSPAQAGDLLNKKSGLLGLTGGASSDLRDIVPAMEAGDADAAVALEVFCYRIRKYIGAYAAALGGLDAVIFTAGIGENSPLVREMSLAGLEHLGLVLDRARNCQSGPGVREIQGEASPAKVLVIPTDEERAIAEQVRRVLATGGR